MKKILIVDKGRLKELANHIMQMFLPLDLDMQTLEILRQNDRDIEEFVKEVYGDGINYSQKFRILHGIVVKLLSIPDNGIDNVLLEELAFSKSIEAFFFKLSMQTEAKWLLQNDWRMDVWNSFRNINSFHDWYCSLINALTGGKNNE